MKNYTRQELKTMIEFANRELDRMKNEPEIVLNSKGAVTFHNMKVEKINNKSIIVSDVDGNEYLIQGKPHKNGYTSGPRIPVRMA
jgi:hypothetical protein